MSDGPIALLRVQPGQESIDVTSVAMDFDETIKEGDNDTFRGGEV